jgi:hypothetical protein
VVTDVRSYSCLYFDGLYPAVRSEGTVQVALFRYCMTCTDGQSTCFGLRQTHVIPANVAYVLVWERREVLTVLMGKPE